jgi:hypothetical protein
MADHPAAGAWAKRAEVEALAAAAHRAEATRRPKRALAARREALALGEPWVRAERQERVERAVPVERRDRQGPAEPAENAPEGSSAAAINVSTWAAINRIAAPAAIAARLTSLTARPASADPSPVATRSTRHTPAKPEASAAAETAASQTKYVATSLAPLISPAVTRRPRRSQAVRSGAASSGRACRRRSLVVGLVAGPGHLVRLKDL